VTGWSGGRGNVAIRAREQLLKQARLDERERISGHPRRGKGKGTIEGLGNKLSSEMTK